jgi:hypothetical protein
MGLNYSLFKTRGTTELAFIERHKQAALSDLRLFGDASSDMAETARYEFQYWASRQEELGAVLAKSENELLKRLKLEQRKRISLEHAENLRRRVPRFSERMMMILCAPRALTEAVPLIGLAALPSELVRKLYEMLYGDGRSTRVGIRFSKYIQVRRLPWLPAVGQT